MDLEYRTLLESYLKEWELLPHRHLLQAISSEKAYILLIWQKRVSTIVEHMGLMKLSFYLSK